MQLTRFTCANVTFNLLWTIQDIWPFIFSVRCSVKLRMFSWLWKFVCKCWVSQVGNVVRKKVCPCRKTLSKKWTRFSRAYRTLLKWSFWKNNYWFSLFKWHLHFTLSQWENVEMFGGKISPCETCNFTTKPIVSSFIWTCYEFQVCISRLLKCLSLNIWAHMDQKQHD